MDFDKVYMVGRELELASNDDVDLAERSLETSFPAGYREYVTHLGAGLLNGFVRIYLPARIVAELDTEFRPRWEEYFFWDAPDASLTKQQVLESVIVGDTSQGDELIFHPGMNGEIFLLPRHSEGLPQIGRDLDEAIWWLFGDDGVHTRVTQTTFEPSRLSGVHYRWDTPHMSFSEVRKMILSHVQDYLVEEDLDGIPDKKRIPQNRMMIFPKAFAAQLCMHQDVLRQGRPMECVVMFDGSEQSGSRDQLFSQLEQIGFEVIERQ